MSVKCKESGVGRGGSKHLDEGGSSYQGVSAILACAVVAGRPVEDVG